MQRHIGCSGYYYNHWKGLFYPDNLPKNKWLIYYSQYFNTVEINNTFYRLPSESSVKNWYSITPQNFVFAIKGYRYFTHLKRLNVDEDLMRNFNDFMRLTDLFKEKTGPVLWQFPASFKANAPRLDNFCKILSTNLVHVFEFRDSSWYNPEIYDILEKYNSSICIISGPSGAPGVIKTISQTAYIRFHGEGAWYRDNYTKDDLEEWKRIIDSLPVRKVFAYFNNDIGGFAVNNARYLKSLYAL